MIKNNIVSYLLRVLTMRKIIIFLILLFSGSVFADTYPASAIYSMQPFGEGSEITGSSYSAVCATAETMAISHYPQFPGLYTDLVTPLCKLYFASGSLFNQETIYESYSCPAGGSLSGTSCINAPPCTAPQVRNVITGMCEANSVLPDCEGVQTPLNTNCKYPTDRGDGIDCADGTTVYPPMVCPVSAWDDKMPPKEGQQKTCSDGRVIGYPTTCFDIFKQQAKDQFGIDKALAIVLNTLGGGLPKAALRVVDNLVTGLPEVRSVVPIAAKVNQTGVSAFTKLDTEIPVISLGKAVSEYIKSSPAGPYVEQLKQAVRSGTAKTELVVNSNTGVVTPGSSLVPLTSNQLARIALQSNSIAPLPLSEIEPYIHYPTVPWLEPALDAIDTDFKRVYDPSGQKAPLNFPQISPTNPLISPTLLESPKPLVTLGPNSPLSYSKPVLVPSSTLPAPSNNTNPTGTDTLTSPLASPAPGTTVDPTAVEAPPEPPTIYPDTWKYFDFLPMANPFVFDVSALLPKLPETSCTYEIHRTFGVPLLGEKHFDFAPCVPLQPLRAVLDWVFAVITAWVCFAVIFRSAV